MYRKILDQLQWRADLLLSGRYEDLSREYLMPLALYLEDHLVVLSSPMELMTLAAELGDVLRARAVTRCEVTVTALELPRDGRFRVWGTWQEISREPGKSRTSNVIYYMRETDRGMQTEMLHFAKLGSTELRNYTLRDRMIA